MAKYAVVDNNKVANIIMAESKEIAEDITGKTCIEVNEAVHPEIGWDVEDGQVIDPNPQPEPYSGSEE